MHHRHLRTTLLGALTAAALLATATPGSADPPAPQPTIEVSGTLVQIAVEPGSGRAEASYAVRLADGDLVPVQADFAGVPATGSRFSGRLAVPTAVRRHLDARGVRLGGSDRVRGSSATGRRVLGLVDAGALPMRVTQSTVTAPARQAVPAAGTTHRLFIAQPTNLGATTTPSDLLATARRVAAYWQGQANGAIAAVQVPSAASDVATYATTVPGAYEDCGLGDPDVFSNMLDEAAARFPGLDPATDQLVIEVPKRCSADGALGLGTVGSGFADGGGLVATADPDFRDGTLAHEMGHNYGFLHANVRCGPRCSDEYAGLYDVMAAGLGGFNQLTALATGYRVANGVTDAGEVLPVDASGSGATRTIAPRSATSGQRSLTVTDPGDGTIYYVDYRTGTGQDDGAAYAVPGLGLEGLPYSYGTGVVLERAYTQGDAQGVVYVPDGDRIAARAGQTWTSPTGDLQVVVGTTSSSAASVRVLLPVVSAQPTMSRTPRAGVPVSAVPGAWASGTSFGYRWYLDGRLVSTAATYTPPLASRGAALVVEVTGTRSGSLPATRDSVAQAVRLPLTRVPLGRRVTAGTTAAAVR